MTLARLTCLLNTDVFAWLSLSRGQACPSPRPIRKFGRPRLGQPSLAAIQALGRLFWGASVTWGHGAFCDHTAWDHSAWDHSAWDHSVTWGNALPVRQSGSRTGRIGGKARRRGRCQA